MRARVRLVTANDKLETERKLEQTLADYYRIEKLSKQDESLWFMYLQEYEWTMLDADFLNDLVEKQNLLAGWHYMRIGEENDRSL